MISLPEIVLLDYWLMCWFYARLDRGLLRHLVMEADLLTVKFHVPRDTISCYE